MAINTARRRASCVGIAITALRTGILPDGGNLNASERLHAAYHYIGIAAGAPPAPPTSVTGYAGWQSAVMVGLWLLMVWAWRSR